MYSLLKALYLETDSLHGDKLKPLSKYQIPECTVDWQKT